MALQDCTPPPLASAREPLLPASVDAGGGARPGGPRQACGGGGSPHTPFSPPGPPSAFSPFTHGASPAAAPSPVAFLFPPRPQAFAHPPAAPPRTWRAPLLSPCGTLAPSDVTACLAAALAPGWGWARAQSRAFGSPPWRPLLLYVLFALAARAAALVLLAACVWAPPPRAHWPACPLAPPAAAWASPPLAALLWLAFPVLAAHRRRRMRARFGLQPPAGGGGCCCCCCAGGGGAAADVAAWLLCPCCAAAQEARTLAAARVEGGAWRGPAPGAHAPAAAAAALEPPPLVRAPSSAGAAQRQQRPREFAVAVASSPEAEPLLQQQLLAATPGEFFV